MSVLVSKRKESRLEVITHAERLHRELVMLLQRNFGIRNIDDFVRNSYACRKIKYENFEYFRYLMTNAKESIDKLAISLTNNLRGANSIYPKNLHELEVRRDYQNNAIVNCNQILKELQRVVEMFDVDINVYKGPIDGINREIGLIKSWRQRDNAIETRLKESK